MRTTKKSIIGVFLLICLTSLLTIFIFRLEAEANQVSSNPFLGPNTIQNIVKQTGPAVVKIETIVKKNPFIILFLMIPSFVNSSVTNSVNRKYNKA